MGKFDEAARFAVEMHAGMMRKGDRLPYILHPMEVASIAASMTDDQDVLCAALLHDVVEDTPTTIDEVAERFGSRVAELVASETEDKRPNVDPSQSWQVRKEESLALLRETQDRGVKMLWLADKLANMRSFSRLHKRLGNRLWDGFNQKDPHKQAWYYAEVAEALAELRETAAWQEYDQLRQIVFEGVD